MLIDIYKFTSHVDPFRPSLISYMRLSRIRKIKSDCTVHILKRWVESRLWKDSLFIPSWFRYQAGESCGWVMSPNESKVV